MRRNHQLLKPWRMITFSCCSTHCEPVAKHAGVPPVDDLRQSIDHDTFGVVLYHLEDPEWTSSRTKINTDDVPLRADSMVTLRRVCITYCGPESCDARSICIVWPYCDVFLQS
jgi:hypothetical protein